MRAWVSLLYSCLFGFWSIFGTAKTSTDVVFRYKEKILLFFNPFQYEILAVIWKLSKSIADRMGRWCHFCKAGLGCHWFVSQTQADTMAGSYITWFYFTVLLDVIDKQILFSSSCVAPQVHVSGLFWLCKRIYFSLLLWSISSLQAG